MNMTIEELHQEAEAFADEHSESSSAVRPPSWYYLRNGYLAGRRKGLYCESLRRQLGEPNAHALPNKPEPVPGVYGPNQFAAFHPADDCPPHNQD